MCRLSIKRNISDEIWKSILGHGLSPNSKKKKKSRPAVYIYKATTLALFAFVIRILFGCWRMPLSSFPLGHFRFPSQVE
jgi:hypothetical protein